MGTSRGRRGTTALVVAALVLAGLLSSTPAGSQEQGSSEVPPTEDRASAVALSVPAIDNTSRTSVNDAWIDVMEPAIDVPSGWTGSVDGCNAGTTSQAAYEATFHAINWAREMAGVGQVTELASMRAQLQETALIMRANTALSHDPPSTWACWTQTGRDGAAANLTMGAGFGAGDFHEGYGANGFMSQMRDAGESNFMVGHRRFNLDPRATQFGVGSTDRTTAIWPEYPDPFGRPDTPLFVPWPSAGWFPDQAEPEGRWSLSMHREADLTNATVTVTPQGGSAFNITPNTNFQFIADDTVVFDFPTVPGPFPNGDPRTYTVTVSGIVDENSGFYPQIVLPSSYTYSVTLFTAVDSTPATAPGVPQGLQATPGDGQVSLSWSAPASNGGSAITSYRVFRDGQQVHQTADGSTTSWTDTGRTNGQQLSYTVAAVNGVGQGSQTAAVLATPTGGGGPTQTFTDVPPTHQFFADVEWMADEGISTGYQPGPTYKPSAAVSRQAMSAFMYRLAGSPSFVDPGEATFGDVAPSHQLFTEIEWMAAEDITTGTAASPKPLYKPASPVSRGAMSAFMHRLADGPGVGA